MSPVSRTTFKEDFRRFFLRGLAIVVPPIVTVWILVQVWILLDSYIGEPVNLVVRYAVAWLRADYRTDEPMEAKGRYVYIPTANVWIPDRVAWVVAAKEPLKGLPADPQRRHELVRKAIDAGDFPTSVCSIYERYIYYQYYLPWHLSFIGLVVAAVGVYFAGRLLATYFGATLWGAAEATLLKVPLVNAVYPHVKQFIEFLLSDRSHQYNRVVAVEYPRRGIWSLGLVTGEGVRALEEAMGEELLTVFVPYTPWSVAGYAIAVPKKDVLDLNVSVEEALRFVVTGGVLRPGASPWKLAGQEKQRYEEVISSGNRPSRTRRTLRLGTRGSQLARAQTRWVAERLKALWPELELEIVEVKTTGDVAAQARLAEVAGQGIFTKELQNALLERRIDGAVHSLKDLPTASVPGLTLAAVPVRVPAWDALVTRDGRGWTALRPEAVVGTSSPRRRAQLLRLRTDLIVRELRGNVPTRLAKLDSGELDAVLVAYAGLARLGLEHRASYIFTCDELLPAPGQGALAVECRSDDEAVLELLQPLNDPEVRAAVEAERAFLQSLGGGCHIPIGAFASVAENHLRLKGGIFAPDGSAAVVAERSGDKTKPKELGAELAQAILDGGGRQLLDEWVRRKER